MDDIELYFNVTKRLACKEVTLTPQCEIDENVGKALDDLEHLTVNDDCEDGDEERYSEGSESSDGEMNERDGRNDNIYAKYDFKKRENFGSLPIDDCRQKIINAINRNSVTILDGATGCGKTTQVPQYIFDNAVKNNEYCSIVCTQPRRIAAISIAQRVSAERCWQTGSIVGYKVGLHANLSEDTRILYCTTGVLLQKLIKSKTLKPFTHIILDEVHDRDQEMDFLLIVIRKFLTTNSRDAKVILMSATINTEEFVNYFTVDDLPPPPVLCVAKGSCFKVSEFYFDDLVRINSKKYEIDYNDPGISNEMFDIALKLLIIIDNIEKQENDINLSHATGRKSNAVLIFLPGINEIDMMCQKILQLKEDDNEMNFMPIRLHSLIPPEEQNNICNSVAIGYRKVILATNIAESSITVPDVTYVIDFCLTKLLVTDSTSHFTSLRLHWASRSNCRQRAGRAGRVAHGRVYRMVDRLFYESSMEEYCIPEMLRCPLQNVILRAKLLDIGSPISILALAINPPNTFDVLQTILILKEIGALFKLKEGKFLDDDGNLTFMGRVMATLPLDIRLTRLILLGYIFNCLEEAIIIAAGLSVRSVFKVFYDPKRRDIEAHIRKLGWTDGSGSDLIAILTVYRKWAASREQGLKDGKEENAWAKRSWINLRNLKEMHILIVEVENRLLQFGIRCRRSFHKRSQWIDREKTLVLKIIIAGAFYPNYFTHSHLNEIDRERSINHVLCGHNPCTTVYFTNFNTRHIGQLYVNAIKDLFRDLHIPAKNIDVHFQPGSERVFVTFKSDLNEEHNDNTDIQNLIVCGKLRPELYKAIRMRMLHMNTAIAVMEPKMEINYAIEHGLGEMVDGVWRPFEQAARYPELVALPSILQKTICGYITHVESCNKFYFQSLAEMERLREINEILNDDDAIKRCKFANPSEIRRGMTLAAPFNGKYKRARVLKVISPSSQHLEFKVWFIDNGNTAVIGFSQLRYFSRSVKMLEEMPPRAFICRLALIQPSLVRSSHGNWCVEAIESLEDVSNRGKVEIEVYSVVEGVANVILRMSNGTFNDFLVEKGYARNSDETYLSKFDHDYRMQQQSSTAQYVDEYELQRNEKYLRSIQANEIKNVPSPPLRQCIKYMKLHGPYSPLETKIISAVKVGSTKGVIIEPESVNAVLLDNDPEDVYERLFVAANTGKNMNENSLIARDITIMPNIPGFGALMTMLFCPAMQIKTNDSCTKYISILAGLGYNKSTFTPLYEEHDIVLNLDVDITPDDIHLINKIRFNMDFILYTSNQDEERPKLSREDQAKMMDEIKDHLIQLLNRERKCITTHYHSKENVWEDLSSNNFIRPNVNSVIENRSIYSLHSIPKLCDEKPDTINALREHCEELHEMSRFITSVKNVKCLLCNQTMDNIVHLRFHLLSQLHRDREHNIHFERKDD